MAGKSKGCIEQGTSVDRHMCLLIVYSGQIYLEKRITLFFIKNFVAEALALFGCVDYTSAVL